MRTCLHAHNVEERSFLERDNFPEYCNVTTFTFAMSDIDFMGKYQRQSENQIQIIINSTLGMGVFLIRYNFGINEITENVN